jgi:hypothetical protein
MRAVLVPLQRSWRGRPLLNVLKFFNLDLEFLKGVQTSFLLNKYNNPPFPTTWSQKNVKTGELKCLYFLFGERFGVSQMRLEDGLRVTLGELSSNKSCPANRKKG